MRKHDIANTVGTLALALAGGMLLMGCSSNKPKSSSGREVVRLGDSGSIEGEEGTRYITTLGLPSDMVIHYPDWIVNPGIEGILGAVGVSGSSALGTREQVEEARLAARMELSKMLETRIQSVGRGELEEHRVASGDPESPAPDGDARRSRLGVERDITDVVMSGSRQRALWFDPLSKDCYVWIVMDGGIPGKAEHNVENGVSIYVANQPISSEYRPERQPEPRKKQVEPAPTPVAPVPIDKTPIEELEDNLKPIEAIPVKEKP